MARRYNGPVRIDQTVLWMLDACEDRGKIFGQGLKGRLEGIHVHRTGIIVTDGHVQFWDRRPPVVDKGNSFPGGEYGRFLEAARLLPPSVRLPLRITRKSIKELIGRGSVLKYPIYIAVRKGIGSNIFLRSGEKQVIQDWEPSVLSPADAEAVIPKDEDCKLSAIFEARRMERVCAFARRVTAEDRGQMTIRAANNESGVRVDVQDPEGMPRAEPDISIVLMPCWVRED